MFDELFDVRSPAPEQARKRLGRELLEALVRLRQWAATQRSTGMGGAFRLDVGADGVRLAMAGPWTEMAALRAFVEHSCRVYDVLG
jgi:hypothetical protein